MAGLESMWIMIFAVKQDDGLYSNLITCVRSTINIPPFKWKKTSNKRKVSKFEACFPAKEGKQVLEQITANQTFSISIDEKDFTFSLGILKRRNPVFIPYSVRNSVANGWWPGTLKNGFWLNEWFCMNSIAEIHPKTKKWIKKNIGLSLEKLIDFENSVIWIESLEQYHPSVHYNPDYHEISFVINGRRTKDDHRVVIQLWEGDEFVYNEMVDFPSGKRQVSIPTPFTPTKTGYELYCQTPEGNWKIIAAANHVILQEISLNLGVVSGKVKINNGKSSTERDIVQYQKSSVTGKSEMPWVEAEDRRIRLNKSQELRDLGSIFVRYNGADTKKEIQDIIKKTMYEDEHEKIYIWDPYVKEEVVKTLLEHAVSYPGLDIRVLLSEFEGERTENEDTLADEYTCNDVAISHFQRSYSIVQLLKKHQDIPLNNLKVRNWFRSNKHSFHDRFIITSKGVWQLGSSLKDLGNYHSTIYRMDEGLSRQIEQEFERAWNGDFSGMNPDGFSISPIIQWIRNKKEEQLDEK